MLPRLFLLIIVLILLVMPVTAQEPIEEPMKIGAEQVTVVADDINIDLLYAALLSVVGLCFGLLALFGGALFALYKSMPEWGQYASREAFEIAMNTLQKLAEMTPSPIDDNLLADFAEEIDTDIFNKHTPDNPPVS